MAGSALKAVNQVLYPIYTGDATLRTLLKGATIQDPRIYDIPKENQSFPYGVTGDGDETKDDTMAKSGKLVRWRPQWWSRYGGYFEIEGIVDRAAALIDDTKPNLSSFGYECIGITHEATRLGRLNDGKTRWALQEFNIWVRQVTS